MTDFKLIWEIEWGAQSPLAAADEVFRNFFKHGHEANHFTVVDEKGKEIDVEAKQPAQFIVCSAIWVHDKQKYARQPRNVDEGYVVCGLRHSDCLGTLQIIGAKDEIIPWNRRRHTQGFLTNDNRFVDRKEAMVIAKAAGQVTRTIRLHELDSSDVW